MVFYVEGTVASSWIDMFAGLSGLYIFITLPAFWATAGSAAAKQKSRGAAIANAPRYRFISVYLPFAAAAHRLGSHADEGYSSSQTSSKRQPLKTLLTIILRFLTRGCQQVANRR